MRNILRWSAVSTAMLLVLAACTPAGSGSPSEAASVAASAAADPAAACDALENGCFEVAAVSRSRSQALWPSRGRCLPGNDSNFGIDVAKTERGQVLGRDRRGRKEDVAVATPPLARLPPVDPWQPVDPGRDRDHLFPHRGHRDAGAWPGPRGDGLAVEHGTRPDQPGSRAVRWGVLLPHRLQRQGPGRRSREVRLRGAQDQEGGHLPRWQPIR